MQSKFNQKSTNLRHRDNIIAQKSDLLHITRCLKICSFVRPWGQMRILNSSIPPEPRRHFLFSSRVSYHDFFPIGTFL